MDKELTDDIVGTFIISAFLMLCLGAGVTYTIMFGKVAKLKTEIAVLIERNSNQQKILSLISKQMPPCECGRIK